MITVWQWECFCEKPGRLEGEEKYISRFKVQSWASNKLHLLTKGSKRCSKDLRWLSCCACVNISKTTTRPSVNIGRRIVIIIVPAFTLPHCRWTPEMNSPCSAYRVASYWLLSCEQFFNSCALFSQQKGGKKGKNKMEGVYQPAVPTLWGEGQSVGPQCWQLKLRSECFL